MNHFQKDEMLSFFFFIIYSSAALLMLLRLLAFCWKMEQRSMPEIHHSTLHCTLQLPMTPRTWSSSCFRLAARGQPVSQLSFSKTLYGFQATQSAPLTTKVICMGWFNSPPPPPPMPSEPFTAHIHMLYACNVTDEGTLSQLWVSRLRADHQAFINAWWSVLSRETQSCERIPASFTL